MSLPKVIQGGMGIGVSGWRLASAVASTGQMGVVSGICLDEILVRKLQIGDPGGFYRKALEHFPIKDISKRIINTFFKDNGFGGTFANIGKQTDHMPPEREDLIVAGSFSEIFLAKQGHNGLIGVNLMEKMQSDCLPLLYGCMLAGVDFVTMGAGIPREIPGALDRLSQNIITTLKNTVTHALDSDSFKFTFNPERFKQKLPLKRPKFIAVISSSILALTLMKKATGKIDGFVVESHRAGGHNAPSRSSKTLSPEGEPVYGIKDKFDLEKIKALNVPFWLAGGYTYKGAVKDALALGAAGIQAGTPFVLTEESAITPELKTAVFNSSREVFTDPQASPTGFPFKIIQVPGTLSDHEIFEKRPRICNMGYLREWYKKEDGSLGTRCPAEPVKAFVAKGGDEKCAQNAKCLCNALFANVGLANSYRNGYTEQPLLTGGDTLKDLDYLYPGITAGEVVNILLGD